MFGLLNLVFDNIVRTGDLTVHDAAGGRHRYGDGTGDPVSLRITDRSLHWKLVLDPNLHLGEGFMNGGYTFERGSVYDFLALLLRNIRQLPVRPRWVNLLAVVRTLTRRLHQHNPLRRARRNVAHHYDLDDRLYSMFLDADMQYSCALFEDPDMSLDEAQLAKKRHIAAKLDIRDGHKILDIGSGWGGMALYLASCADVEVVGVTLSENQLETANRRASETGMADRVEFRLQDYRTLTEKFDRIVSVGMFEHVGVGYYRRFFTHIRELLKKDGIALLHSLGRFDGPGFTNPWIDKYIFPGGYIPALSEVLPHVEKCRLLLSDVEILRLHYAETLRHWRQRFMARRDEALTLFDERFCRMWEFYLAASEATIRYDDIMVFQVQLLRDQNVLPLTRDYINRWENARKHQEEDARRPRIAGE